MRYMAKLPLAFFHLGLRVPNSGFTRDMSTTGAFIVTTISPSVETDVDITFFLKTSDGERQLLATGRVSRIEMGDGIATSVGFAVKFASELVLRTQPKSEN